MPGNTNLIQYSTKQPNLAKSIFFDLETSCYKSEAQGLVGALNTSTGEFTWLDLKEFPASEVKQEIYGLKKTEEELENDRFRASASKFQLDNHFFDGWALFKVTRYSGRWDFRYSEDGRWIRKPPMVELIKGFYNPKGQAGEMVKIIVEAVSQCEVMKTSFESEQRDLIKLLKINDKAERIKEVRSIISYPFQPNAVENLLGALDLIAFLESSNPNLPSVNQLVLDYIAYLQAEGENESKKVIQIQNERAEHRALYANSQAFFKPSVQPFTFTQWLETPRVQPQQPLQQEIKGDAPPSYETSMNEQAPAVQAAVNNDRGAAVQTAITKIMDTIKSLAFESKIGTRIKLNGRMVYVPVIIAEIYNAILGSPDYVSNPEEAKVLLKELKDLVADERSDNAEVNNFCQNIRDLFISLEQQAVLAIKDRIATDENLGYPPHLESQGTPVDLGNGRIKSLPPCFAVIFKSINNVGTMDQASATTALVNIQQTARDERSGKNPNSIVTGFQNNFLRLLKRMNLKALNIASLKNSTMEAQNTVSVHTS